MATTEVIVTGTGFPRVDADRAGPGVLVRRAGLTMQFDAGRATSMRLAALGVGAWQLDVLFVTHHHSDHLLGLADLVHSRWILSGQQDLPLAVVAPRGPASELVQGIADGWQADIDVRNAHRGTATSPSASVTEFVASDTPQEVWRHDEVRVSSVLVDHGIVVPSVGYRVSTPEGSVVISGDTRVCSAIEELAYGADVLVHEVILDDLVQQAPANPIAQYHANAVELGAMAQRAKVRTLMLTHLIPAPSTVELHDAYVEEIRRGGFTGELFVSNDLDAVQLHGDA